MSAINIVFNLALSYYYLQLLNCLLCHAVTDPFGLQIYIFPLAHYNLLIS